MDKHEFESLSIAMDYLNENGYTDTFQTEDGKFKALYSKRAFTPDQLTIDRAYRFNNLTDPADESELFALSSDDGTKGTLVISYSYQSDKDRQLLKKIKESEDTDLD